MKIFKKISPNTIEELLRKKRSDHILTMKLIKDICRRIKKLERKK